LSYTFVSATVLLVLITDPFGNIPVFINALKPVAPDRKVVVILREVAIAFVILLLFMLVGDRFLQMMSLTPVSLKIGGGIVLFLIAVRMIFPQPDVAGALVATQAEPLIVPLAIPGLAGPSALATVMLLTSQAPGQTIEWIGALSVTMAICAVVLTMAERIQRFLGERTVMAFERLAGIKTFVHEI
jgi:small neutral amino acid transporter SnatA (MarC family)